MQTEKIKFKLELYATMWDKAPHVQVSINGRVFHKGEITGTEAKPNVIEFEETLVEKQKYELCITSVILYLKEHILLSILSLGLAKK